MIEVTFSGCRSGAKLVVTVDQIIALLVADGGPMSPEVTPGWLAKRHAFRSLLLDALTRWSTANSEADWSAIGGMLKDANAVLDEIEKESR